MELLVMILYLNIDLTLLFHCNDQMIVFLSGSDRYNLSLNSNTRDWTGGKNLAGVLII
jgi:hypothetical protein